MGLAILKFIFTLLVGLGSWLVIAGSIHLYHSDISKEEVVGGLQIVAVCFVFIGLFWAFGYSLLKLWGCINQWLILNQIGIG